MTERGLDGWLWTAPGVGNHLDSNGHIDMVVNCPNIPETNKEEAMTKKKSIYDGLSRKYLIECLEKRDEVITKLSQRTIDDYVRDLIEDAMLND